MKFCKPSFWKCFRCGMKELCHNRKIKKFNLLRYIRVHWKSLHIYGFALGLTLFLVVSGAKIISGDIENPFTFDTITGLFLIVFAIQFFNFYSKIAERIRETEGVKK